MSIRRFLVATTAALCAGVAAPPLLHAQLGVQTERNVPGVYAITNARIVPVSGPVIERGTLVVRNGLIAAVGTNVRVPADARTIDGTGLSVYPGFMAAYTTLGVQDDNGAQGAGGRGGAARGGGPNAASGDAAATIDPAPNSLHPAGLQPEVSVVDLLHDDGDYTAAQAAGFTTALTAPASGIFVGESAVISLRDGQVRDILIKSPIAMHIAFQPPRRGRGRRAYPSSLMGVFAALRQMLLDAQHYGAVQAAYAANPRGMPRPDNDPSLAALQPVLSKAMPVIMEANSKREIIRALDLADEFHLRAMIVGGEEAYMVTDRLKAEHVPVLLSMDFPQRPAAAGRNAEPEPLRVLRARVEAPRTPGRLADAGVTVALAPGADGYPRFLANLRRAVDDGMSKDAALHALTLTPATLFGVSDRLGTIEPGKIANLTITRGDVFDATSRVTRLFVDGRPIEPPPPAAGARGATTTGTWTVTVTIDGADKPVTLALQQAGSALRGSLQGSLGSAQISNASIEADSAFTFTASVTLPDGTEEATFTGTRSGNTMRGAVKIVGHPDGTFVGTRPNGGRGRRSGRPQR